MNCKFLFLFILIVQQGYSQNVSIKLTFENVSDSIAIIANKSINDDASYFLTNTDTIYTKDNYAELKFNTVNAGYMYFSFSKVNPVINVLYEPGDTIQLNVTKDKDNKYHVQFLGKNYHALLLINTDTIYKYQKQSHKLRKVIFEANRGSDILNFIKEDYTENQKKLKDFFDTGKISKSIYEVSKLYLEDITFYMSRSIVEDIFRIEEEYVKTKLPKSEFLDLLNNLMQEFNPFDEKFINFTSYSTLENQQTCCRYINESMLDEKRFDKGLWKNKNVKDYYNFMPLHYQERFFAFLFVNNRLDENDLKQFKEVFPKSRYTNYLETYWKKRKVAVYKPFSFGYFINGKFEYYKQVKSTDINSIITDNFKGKPVFVDLWASYCAPCFQEFSHSQKLFSFLMTNKIEMLYLSIDREDAINKWLPTIKNSYLEGNHIFGTDKIQESLQILLNEPNGVYIPRYLLFNANGELVLPSTKKPSEGKVLYDEILNALK